MTTDQTFTTLQLSIRAKVHTSRVLRDVRSGKITATRLGRDVLFDPDQFDAAVKHYREDAKRKRDAKRTRRDRPVAADDAPGTGEQRTDTQGTPAGPQADNH